MAEYIDRQEVIETLAFYREDPDGIDHALNSVKSIPSADVAPVVHGRWINTMPIVEYKSFCQVKCSVCESIEAYGNFCRNCGADMRGE